MGTPEGRAEDRAERRPNMRNKSSIFRYGGLAYLEYRSATVRQIPYVGGEGEISRYLGVGEDAGDRLGEDFGEHVDEHAVEDGDDHVDEDLDEDLDEEADEDRVCFWHSSRKCRCSWFFDENTISQCLQDGLLHMFSCVCRMRRAIEENEALQSLQWWYSSAWHAIWLISCGGACCGASCGACCDACGNLAFIASRLTARS